MKKILITLFFLIMVLLQMSCKDVNSNNSYNEITTIRGAAYIQPLDRITALSCASVKTEVYFDFLDSTYCNIRINTVSGNVIQSRKYSINSANTLTLENPLNDKKVCFKMVINATDSTTYLIDAKGEKIFNMVLLSDKVRAILNSGNELKKGEFLYPTLNAKEREFGAEGQFMVKDGVMRLVPHPMYEKAKKINVYELF